MHDAKEAMALMTNPERGRNDSIMFTAGRIPVDERTAGFRLAYQQRPTLAAHPLHC
jgi:hypothetical protein